MTLLDLGVSSAIAKYASKYKSLNDYKSVNVVIASGIVILLAVGLILISLSPFIANLVVSAFKIDDGLTEMVHTPVSYTHLTLPTICSV